MLEQRLPAATYTELFGLDTHLAELGEELLAPHAPWLVSVEGLGGSGKTALAHQLIQKLAQRGPARSSTSAGSARSSKRCTRAGASGYWVCRR